jgi:hypothetical protein
MVGMLRWAGERRVHALLVVAAGVCAVVLPFACGSSGASDAPAVVDAGAPVDARNIPPQTDAVAAEDAGGQLPSFNALVANDSLWTLIQNPGSCNLREGKTLPDPFPKRIWSTCGAGCRVAQAGLPFQELNGPHQQGPSGGYVGSDIFLLLPLETGTARVLRVERLSDGATLAAVLDRGAFQDSSCLQAWSGSAPFLFSIVGAGGAIRFGRAPRQPGAPILWHSQWLSNVPAATELFDFDLGYGVGTDGTPVLFKSPDDLNGTDLVGSGHVAHGLGSQLVWGGTTGSIRSYAADGGGIDLVPIATSRDVHKLRLSAERMVWISAARNGDAATDARWHWSPRATEASSVVVHDGPSLPFIADGGTDMAVGGDWAATIGSDGTSIHFYVWHITTGETWELPNRPGFQFKRILSVSPTEMVLGETVAGSNAGLMHNLVRVDLASLPGLVGAWSK